MGRLDAPVRRATATAIRRFGRSVTLRRIIEGVFQPALDTVANTPVDHPVRGVVTAARATADGLVRSGDKQVMVAAADLPLVPDATWKVLLDGVVHDVVLVDSPQASDEPAAHILTVRGAP